MINNINDIRLEDLTEDVYDYYKHKQYNREFEHQIGRLKNMSKLIKYIKDNNIDGDFIEFGVYQGFSLMWLAKFRDIYGLNNKIIGIDSFEGLPISSTCWGKGNFNDTSIELAGETIKNNDNIVLIKSWFNNPELLKNIQSETNKLSLIHIDCDLKYSLKQVFDVIRTYLTDIHFILFDDWGINDEEIPSGFREWQKENLQFNCEMISETDITRYYKIEKI